MSEYLGFKEIEFPEGDSNIVFGKEMENKYGLLQNEYLVAKDTNDNVLELFKNDNNVLKKVPYKAINTRYSGKVKPRNTQQKLAIDMLYDQNSTVKVITGKFGTGEILAPLYSNV